MSIWISKRLYIQFPWICAGIATIAILLPEELLKYACIAYLYGYAFYVWYIRSKHQKSSS